MDKRSLVLSLASGFLLFLSFPKFDLNYLIWFSLVPLLYALQGKTLYEAFRTGFVAGLTYNIGIIYWITFVVAQYGQLPLYLGFSVMLLLSLYLSLYIALFSAGVVFFKRRGIREIVSAPVIWTCLEYGKSHLLTGFPWENLAYSLHKMIPVVQIVDVTGTYGLTFLIVFINCIIYDLFEITGKSRKKVLSEIVLGFIIILMVFGYGEYRLHHLENIIREKKSEDITIIQGNIDQNIKWNNKYQMNTLKIYGNLSLEMSKSGTHLIVWPETAAPFFFQNIDDRHRYVLNVARESKAYLLFGSPSLARKNGRNYYFNSAYLTSPGGEVVGKYDKVHLVPYGEYVPFRNLCPFLDKLVVGVGDFVPGAKANPLLMGDKKIGVLICYEGIFPRISREYKNSGVELLVNITNDAWFGTSSAPYQHLTMAAFRAVENHVYMIRAANTGISAIIGPTGEIISRTGLFERTSLNGKVQFLGEKTFYSKYGDVFACLCFIFLAIIFLRVEITGTRRKFNDRRYFAGNQ